LAVKRTDKRRQEEKKSEKLDAVMCRMIKGVLEDYLSPEQISRKLLLEKDVKITCFRKHIFG
jgi:IS30 family transposase